MNSHISLQVWVHHNTETSATGCRSFGPRMVKIMLTFWPNSLEEVKSYLLLLKAVLISDPVLAIPAQG